MGTTYDKYRAVYDYHTHTTYSHGKGSIEDNVKAAIAAGLRGIGISDHGPGHLTYGFKRENIPKMRAEIEALRLKYPQIEIFMSVEANIISTGNFLDVTKDEFGSFDYVIAGYHYGVKNGYCVRNYISEHLGKSNVMTESETSGRTKDLLVKNTEMTVKALYENKIKILTHPGDKGPFDMDELARACENTGTLMEISTWHKHLTLDEIKRVAKYDVNFVVSSDAHTPDRVGDVADGIKRALAAGLDPARIVNIEKITEEE